MRSTRTLVALAIGALLFGACGILPGGGGGGGTTLTIAAVQGGESAGLKAVEGDYETAKGVTINIEELPYAQHYEKLVSTFDRNQATYDLVMLDDPWMPKFGTDGSLQDLGQYGISRDPDIAGVIYDVGTWPPPRGPKPPGEENKTAALLGVTVVGNVEMFMYRSDLSEAPATWDDVLANAQEQDKEGFAGYVIRGAATNPVVADFLPILWSFGGDVFDENWNVVIDSEESMAAVTFLVEDLAAVAQEDPASTDAADRSRLIAIGEGYQSTVWPGEVTDIVNNEEVSTQRENIAYIPIPAGPSGKGFGMMGNWLLGIPKASTKGQAAADFIKWITQADIQKTYAERGGIPSRTSILQDATLGAANPYFKALADSLAAGPNWRPRTAEWNAVETILGTHLNAALAGTEEPEAAISAAAEAIRKHMQGAGYPTE